MLCNAGMNIIAPFFGIGGVTISKTSVAATEDNAKSGLVPIVASVGFLISLFIMVFPVLFATITYPVNSMNQWNYNSYGNGGFVYLMKGASFGIAAAVMLCVGLSMLRMLKKVDWRDITDWIPAVITVIVSVMLTNIALGVACGVILFSLIELLAFFKGNFNTRLREIGIPTAVLMVLMTLMLVMI
jgi:xanthine/uracil/vitamin C permease (AzgA family)